MRDKRFCKVNLIIRTAKVISLESSLSEIAKHNLDWNRCAEHVAVSACFKC